MKTRTRSRAKRGSTPANRALAAEWATLIGIPLDAWPGRCAEIAEAVVAHKLTDGRPVRGLWVGPVAPGSKFEGRPFSGHSWIERANGLIVDPTRWAFEMKAPYIFRGMPGPEYDKGGNRIREAMAGPCPSWDDNSDGLTLDFVSVEAAQRVRALLPPDSLALDDEPWVTCSARQLHWLANLAPQRFGVYAVEVYRAIKNAGYGGHIPVDNQREILGAAVET